MVKMFHVQFVDDEDEFLHKIFAFRDYRTYIDSTHFVLVKLSEALVEMSNLVDLRILHSRTYMDDSNVYQATQRLSKVIRYISRRGNDSD